MHSERRSHRRIKPKGLSADIILSRTNDQELPLNGDILDISYSGIRIKLSKPLASNIEGKVKITMTLPESGAPFIVHGTLKHQFNDDECGLHYTGHSEESIDDLMFECIKLNDMTLLIKTA
ncbi:PilZ domain-containing protein [Methylicorpusculum oleiharenae]|uniref:PilZ domain-containing protein n=1 Tax=Methylicorpusculum oleiharenae TaxID=1338687 RepID=UPI001359B682|nr:PilZ domain-containing protein [Methylicorpusculum oleiharenae]MCD2449267.1 PilZ domain-containing protein [Methylicorpusculum oleiharenae]